MNKLMNKIKENNKGFTLVELIVVIAVLAVITVVAAPQYLKYVEKSRVGTDENALGEIAHIAEIEWVGLEAAKDANETVDNAITVTVVDGLFAIEDSGDLDAAVANIMGEYEVKSDTYANANITITITNGVADWDKLTIS